MAGKLTLPVVVNGQNVLASFEDFLAIEDDRPIVEVAVPQWGNKYVLMRAMSALERDEWEYRFIKDEHIEPEQEALYQRMREQRVGPRVIGAKAELVARCVVDRDGNRVFTDDQAALLQQRNAAAIDLLAAKANELCGFTQDDMAKLEQARKANASRSDADASS